MGNFGRHRVSKSKGKTSKKPVQEEEEEEVACDQDQAVVMDAGEEEEETKKKTTMVVLQCEDGVELVVPKEEASRYGTDIDSYIRSGHYHDAYVQTRSSCNKEYPLINLSVRSDILSKVIHYSNQQASDPGWDATGFFRGLDRATLVDLILAATELENRGLLGDACRAVADLIADKSPCQIRAMFGIRPYSEAATAGPDFRRAVKTISPDDQNMEEERALRALHIVRCQEFTAYDPKRRDYWCTRFCCYNIAFFDLDKECEYYYLH